MDEFDVVVIGGGAAGENIAGRCFECGLSIAIVEAAKHDPRLAVPAYLQQDPPSGAG